jgi:MFS family permease
MAPQPIQESEIVEVNTPAPSSKSTTPSAPAPQDLDFDCTQPLTPVPSNAVSVEDVPPEGLHGWICAFCVFLINANTWGVNSAWAIFLARYLADSTFPGASQLEYALIGGLSISQSLLVSPLVAISNRKLGSKPTLLIGAVLVAVAWLGASFATRIWHLFLTIGCCFGYGMGFLYITAAAILPQWFLRHRSLAVGLASSGAGIGGLAYNLGAGAAVESLGIQWTYRVLSICSLLCNVACSLVLKDRNKQVKPSLRSFDHKELSRVEVILVIGWGFLTELGYIVLLYSLPHYALSIGLTARQGSIVGAMLSLGLGVGRPFIGYFSDSWGRINMAGLMTALCGILCIAIWLPAKSFGVLVTFALLAGPVCGIFWATVTAVTAEVVGLKRLPSTFGIICMALVLPTTFAEPLGLEIVSAAGFATSQGFVGAVFLLAAVCVWLLRSWKIVELDMKSQREAGYAVNQQKWEWLMPAKLFCRRKV